MKKILSLLLFVFLGSANLAAQEAQQTVVIEITKTTNGEVEVYNFKHLIDDKAEVDALIEQAKEAAGIHKNVVDNSEVLIDMNVTIDDGIDNEFEEIVEFENMAIDEEEVYNTNKPYLGLMLDIEETVEKINDRDFNFQKINIVDILPNGPGALAGIQTGDELVSINNTRIKGMNDINQALNGKQAGDKVNMNILRNGKEMTLPLTLANRPNHFNQASRSQRIMKQYNGNCNASSKSCCAGKQADDCCNETKHQNKAVLGVTVEEKEEGVQVTQVHTNSAAEKAGIRPNDVILKVEKQEVATPDDLIQALKPYLPNEKVKMTYVRNGKTKKVKATLQAPKTANNKAAPQRNSQKFNMPSSTDNVKIVLLEDDEIEKLMNGEEINVNVVAKNGEAVTEKVKIQLESAEPCPEFSVIISRLDEAEIATVSKNDQSIDMNKMSDLEIINLSLYPNPNVGKFELAFNLTKKEPVMIRMVGLNGKEIYRENVSNFNGSYSNLIDITQNSAGIYVLQIIQGQQIMTRKVVIE